MVIKSRVLQQLGQDNADFLDGVANPEDVYTRAYWECLSLIPPKLILSQLHAPADPEASVAGGATLISDFSLDDKRELLIFRTVADHVMNQAAIDTVRFITKACKRISLQNSKRALDSSSIYFSTDNSPVYWYQNVGGVQKIKTAPVTTGWTNSAGSAAYMPNDNSALQVFAIKRHTFTTAEIGTSGGLTDFPLDDAYIETDDADPKKLPEELEGLVIKKIAHSFLAELIANASVQDEDPELVQIYSTEAQLLMEMITNEIKVLNDKFGEGA